MRGKRKGKEAVEMLIRIIKRRERKRRKKELRDSALGKDFSL